MVKIFLLLCLGFVFFTNLSAHGCERVQPNSGGLEIYSEEFEKRVRSVAKRGLELDKTETEMEIAEIAAFCQKGYEYQSTRLVDAYDAMQMGEKYNKPELIRAHNDEANKLGHILSVCDRHIGNAKERKKKLKKMLDFYGQSRDSASHKRKMMIDEKICYLKQVKDHFSKIQYPKVQKTKPQ